MGINRNVLGDQLPYDGNFLQFSRILEKIPSPSPPLPRKITGYTSEGNTTLDPPPP